MLYNIYIYIYIYIYNMYIYIYMRLHGTLIKLLKSQYPGDFAAQMY